MTNHAAPGDPGSDPIVDWEEGAKHRFWARVYSGQVPVTPELMAQHSAWIRERLGIPERAALTAAAPERAGEGDALETSGFVCCEGNGRYRVVNGEWQCQHCEECWPLDYPMHREERIND